MTDDFQQRMRDATKLTLAGRLAEATDAIQRALREKAQTSPAPNTPESNAANTAKPGAVTLDASATVPGGNVYEVDMGDNDAPKADEAAPLTAVDVASKSPPADTTAKTTARPLAETTAEAEVVTPAPIEVEISPEAFINGTHQHASKTLHYKIYLPPGHAGHSEQTSKRLPLVVMLHGCKQDPDDFATGTGMNAAAREQGFFVLYPAQSEAANAMRCWNWFQSADQQRGRGEPAMIADLTQTMIQRYPIDAQHVYIAGLSAGGAMAAIVADAYPEMFAAVGVHSGLRRGAASNMAEAFRVMQSGAGKSDARMSNSETPISVPTIVFHGDNDRNVHPRNGAQVIAAVKGREGDAKVETGTSTGGRQYTRSAQVDAHGNRLTEHWLVHGAGHAWSGGNAAGSFTDASGPDATREMLRFFFSQSANT